MPAHPLLDRLLHRPRPLEPSDQARLLQKLQLAKTIKAYILFFAFAALVAPLEYHLKWINLWANSLDFYGALQHPLISGILYFYAAIMAIEAFLVLSLYPEVKEIRFMSIVQIALAATIVSFLADYVVTGHYPAPWNSDTPQASPSQIELQIEFWVAIVALVGSFLVHCAAIKFESRNSSPSPEPPPSSPRRPRRRSPGPVTPPI